MRCPPQPLRAQHGTLGVQAAPGKPIKMVPWVLDAPPAVAVAATPPLAVLLLHGAGGDMQASAVSTE